jgi:hypothetical protein
MLDRTPSFGIKPPLVNAIRAHLAEFEIVGTA